VAVNGEVIVSDQAYVPVDLPEMSSFTSLSSTFSIGSAFEPLLGVR
jgi:hypothetical protein